jgi:hypothetical protein
MIKITTKSGAVYEIYPDTKNWKRHVGNDGNVLEIETGIYDTAYFEVGKRMQIESNVPEGHPMYPCTYFVHSTPVTLIEYL